VSSNAVLNTALIEVYRSLLQYAGESWPWAAAGSDETETAVRQMAAEERGIVSRIFHHLDSSGLPVDLGTYPDNSALHYASLPFFLQRMVSEHADLDQSLRYYRQAVSQDQEASRLLDEAIGMVERHLARIRQLAAPAGAAA
jgi:hypothetical protein